MDWFRWHPALYEADTVHLTAAQDGVYRRLIDWYMQKRQPPPSPRQAVANISRISLEEWISMEVIILPFFREKNGFLHHKRCDIELERQDRRSKELSELGKKGAEKRKENSILQATATAVAKRRLKQRRGEEKREEDSKGNGANAPDIHSMILLWNEFASQHELSLVQVVSGTRSRKAAKRLKECGGIEGFKTVLEKIAASDFLLGRNAKGWRADFDFVITQSKFTKIMEGAYDGRKGIGSFAERACAAIDKL